ncbi:MAG: TetR/AcrR family transcriptional regulator, partial [Saprospiraceae bacterium]
MDELANQLGISKKTIYQYYADKHALVDDVMTEVINKSQIICQDTSRNAENAVDEIFMTMKQIRKDFL